METSEEIRERADVIELAIAEFRERWNRMLLPYKPDHIPEDPQGKWAEQGGEADLAWRASENPKEQVLGALELFLHHFGEQGWSGVPLEPDYEGMEDMLGWLRIMQNYPFPIRYE